MFHYDEWYREENKKGTTEMRELCILLKVK